MRARKRADSSLSRAGTMVWSSTMLTGHLLCSIPPLPLEMGSLGLGGRRTAINELDRHAPSHDVSRTPTSVFESMEKAQAAHASTAYLEARKIGDKYANLRIFAAKLRTSAYAGLSALPLGR